MKALSASIIVVAGSAILIAANLNSHGDAQLMLSAIGCAVAGFGLYGWFQELRRP